MLWRKEKRFASPETKPLFCAQLITAYAPHGLSYAGSHTKCKTMTIIIIILEEEIQFEKLVVPHLVKKFPEIHLNRRFITIFTTAHHLPYSQPH